MRGNPKRSAQHRLVLQEQQSRPCLRVPHPPVSVAERVQGHLCKAQGQVSHGRSPGVQGILRAPGLGQVERMPGGKRTGKRLPAMSTCHLSVFMFCSSAVEKWLQDCSLRNGNTIEKLPEINQHAISLIMSFQYGYDALEYELAPCTGSRPSQLSTLNYDRCSGKYDCLDRSDESGCEGDKKVRHAVFDLGPTSNKLRHKTITPRKYFCRKKWVSNPFQPRESFWRRSSRFK